MLESEAGLGPVEVVIESPRGSTVHTVFEPGKGWVQAGPAFPRPLPAEYGYLPGTYNPADGNPVDVVVIGYGPTFPGCRYRVRAIGLLLRADGDHKVLAVPHTEEYVSPLQDFSEVSAEVLAELEGFFGLHFPLLGWRDARWAEEWIVICRAVAEVREART